MKVGTRLGRSEESTMDTSQECLESSPRFVAGSLVLDFV